MKNTYLNFKSAVFAIGTVFITGIVMGQCSPCDDSPTCPTIPTNAGNNFVVIYCTPRETTPCEFRVPVNVSAITVETWGAGGGGGGAWSRSRQSGYEGCAAGGGGGGGAYTTTNLSVIGGERYLIHVGKGGDGGLGGNSNKTANNGTSGGSSYIAHQNTPLVRLVEARGGGLGGGAHADGTSNGAVDRRDFGLNGAGGLATVASGYTSYNGGYGTPGIVGGSYDKGGLGGGGAGSGGQGKTPVSNNNTTENGGDITANCGGSGGGRGCRPSGNGAQGCNGLSASTTNGVGGGGSGGATHCTFNNNKSNSGGNGSNGMVRITFSNPLAVTLSSFNISCENGRTIKWSTESEKNASHFVVERSRDGADWFQIGQLNATGTTNQTQHYSLQDKSTSYGISYYRLKEVDFDGEVRVYDVVASDCSYNSGMIVYPNPTQGNFVLEINSEMAFEGIAVVYDLNGKALIQREINASKGISLVYFDSNNLANGTYIVKIEGDNKGEFQPIKLVVN